MTQTVLEICQDAARELSLVVPTSVASAVDDVTADRLFRMINRVCRTLQGEHDWQILRREHTFTTSAAAAQTGAIPSDFGRFIPGSMWNRTRMRQIEGPLTPEQWQQQQAHTTSSTYDQMMMRAGSLLITPTPSTGHTIAYEYITSYIGTDTTAATGRTKFTADTDLPYFDDELVIMGVVWRYRQSEGLDYAEPYRDYQMRISNLLKTDGNRRILDMNGEKLPRLPNVTGNQIEDLVSL